MAHLNPVLQSRQDGLETQLQQLQSEPVEQAQALTKDAVDLDVEMRADGD